MIANKNIKLLNAYSICMNMSFVIGVIMPYYRDELGLNFQQFLLGEAAFSAVVVFLEVPSGWVSDVWRRKTTLAAAVVFDIIGYTLLMCGHGFAAAVTAQAIIGVAICMISGTNTALLYDSLLSEGRESEFRVREGKRASFGFYSVAGASVISGFLYTLDHHLPIAATLLADCVALICAVNMIEPLRHKKAIEKHPLADMIATARYALHGHADVGMIILFSAALFCATKQIMWSQQAYYMALGLHESIFGVLMAAGFLLAGISSQLGHKLDGKVGNLGMLGWVCVAAICICVGAAVHLGLSGVALLMIGGTCLFGVAGPRVAEAINKRVDSSRRATILSTQSLMVNLFFIPISAVMGWVSTNHGIQGALLAVAGWLVIAGLLLVALLIKKERRQRLMML